MTNIVTRKRLRPVTKMRNVNKKNSGERYIVDAQGKRVAVVLDLEEYRRLVAGRQNKNAPFSRLSATQRAKLVALARRAEGNWKETEPRGTSVEIVRRLRDEWNRVS